MRQICSVEGTHGSREQDSLCSQEEHAGGAEVGLRKAKMGSPGEGGQGACEGDRVAVSTQGPHTVLDMDQPPRGLFNCIKHRLF